MKKLLTIATIIIVVIAGIILVHGRVDAPTKPSPGSSSTSSKISAPAFDKTRYSTTDPASPWVVVNKQHPLNPIDYAPSDLTDVGGGQVMRAEAATALQQMLSGAQAAGFTVTAASGYRSYATQVSVYNNEIKSYGKTTADSESARPGYSEHQTGWAVDLASGGCSITDCFGTTPGGEWVTANAYKYGFLLRYTQADTATTGYRAEAWHFRYIGTLLSNELHNENVSTLEQFFEISGGATYK